MSNFCSHCGTSVSPSASACPSCGHPLAGARSKSKVVTLILGLLLGAFGAHRFYLRDYGLGALMLFACFLFTFDPSGVLLTLAGVVILIDIIVLMFRGRDYYIKKAAK